MKEEFPPGNMPLPPSQSECSDNGQILLETSPSTVHSGVGAERGRDTSLLTTPPHPLIPTPTWEQPGFRAPSPAWHVGEAPHHPTSSHQGFPNERLGSGVLLSSFCQKSREEKGMRVEGVVEGHGNRM